MTGAVAGFERQRLERRARVDDRCDVVPGNEQRRRLRRTIVPAQRVRVAGVDLFAHLDGGRAHFIGLGDEHERTAGRREVVEQRGAAIRDGAVGEQFLERHDVRLIDPAGGPLGRRIVGADGLDRVADELEPDRLPRARRIEIDDAAARGELARFVGRILSGVARLGEEVAQIDG